ncbi:MAG: sulfatase-like hydrolase/transferase [Chloroflexota bacterium]|nr:sulfatase-like hydrolase/transferase [Chloroflexota bacterium]MDE2910431.1 sulfatase-like hydrolase/transferase [Chloroflexota bacterium]
MTKPNILFIVADQHNAKVLGHQGHPDVKTPHLDGLAREGCRFNNAITQNPICSPSRVSFLSGQYPHNHGYYSLSGPNPGGLPNIFGHFRAAGYFTAAMGKIHCPEYWVEDQCDVFHESNSWGAGSIVGRSKEYTRFLRERGVDELEDHILLPEFGERGRQSVEGRPSPLAFDESQEGWLAHTAIATMQRALHREQPFLLHVSFPRPHQCTTPCQEFWDLYDGKALSLPPNADYDLASANKAPHMIASARRWREGAWPLFEPKTFEAGRLRKLRGYLGAVSQVDAAVGSLLDFLRKTGQAENTIVVYTSDHGDYATEHGIMEKAPGICSDAITRVPLIWRAPGRVEAGGAVDDIVELVDIPNTLCALAGIDLMETSDGRDISGLLAGVGQREDRIGLTEFAWSKSIRKGQYRLVHYPRAFFPDEYPDGFGELYDLGADPWEMRNQYFDSDYQHIVSELRGELLERLITTTRPRTVSGVNSARFDTPEVNPQRAQRYQTVVNLDGKINPALLHSAANKNYL